MIVKRINFYTPNSILRKRKKRERLQKEFTPPKQFLTKDFVMVKALKSHVANVN